MTPLQELTERPRAAGPVRALVCLSDAICRQRASSESPPRVRETLCVLSRGSLRGSRRFRPQGKEWEGADPQAVALSRLLPHRLCARKNRAVSARGSLLTPLAVLSCAIFLTLHSNLFSSICIGAAGVRVLEVARQGALSSTAAAEHGQVPQDAPLPPRAAWLCRMAYNGEGCGSAVNAALGTSGAFCDKDQCCPISSSKCTNTSGFCVDSSSLQQGHSWGKCNRTQCARCGPNASCAFVASTSLTRGGVYCKCDPPFVGTGATCEMEACKEANPCGSGTCVPSTEPGRQYSCQCNPGYVEVMSGVATSHATCVNLCEHSGCSQSPGVEACIGGVNSHLCICKHGYRLSVDRSTGSTQCVLNDPCSIFPCGTKEVVEKCETASSGLDYTCTCKAGYVVRYINGTQVCLSEQDPCTAPICSEQPPKIDFKGETTTTTPFPKEDSQGGKEEQKGDQTGEDGGGNAAAIAGGLVGGLAVLAVVGGGGYYYASRRRSPSDRSEARDSVVSSDISSVFTASTTENT